MAPLPITKDYYMILEVEQTATHQIIVSSYRRLALKLHPDRNTQHDATGAFQLLVRAYETLKDEGKRREYDLIYPSITRRRTSSQNTQTPHPHHASTPQTAAPNEAAQIAAIQKSKQERGARWRTIKSTFDSTIFELQRSIRRLEQEIQNLNSIVAAEAAEEARKNSWATWLLSPLYKKAEDSEEEKARKDRGRQERRIEKDMKERRLESKKADLKKEENLTRKAKEDIDAADLADDMRIRVIQARLWAREDRERRERERVERERIAEIWKQQQEQREKREREAAETLRRQRAERQAAELKRQEEETRTWERYYDEIRRSQEQYTPAYTSTCRHDGWWPKVQGRTACPKCGEVWTYLLECPSCGIKACPRCQAAIRPRVSRNTARTFRRAPPRVRTPSPNYDYDWY